MLLGRVALGLVGAQEPAVLRDLHGVPHHPHLHPQEAVAVPHPVARPGEEGESATQGDRGRFRMEDEATSSSGPVP